MTWRTWSPRESLSEPRTWLLEASAGTGKTYQISGLVVRVVAELGIPVRDILAITFTEAATAELRDRIRRGLRDALDRLSGPPTDDESDVLTHLRSLNDVARQRLRLELALRDFDQAPVSTIHGFCQRTLQELAFESCQDGSLELLENPQPILERLVEDALARLYAGSSAAEVATFRAAGYTRQGLLETAKKVCGPSAPRIVPEVEVDLDEVRKHCARLAVMQGRWTSPEGRAARKKMIADHGHVKGSPEHYRTWPGKIGEWLAAGADLAGLAKTAQKNIRPAWFKDNWKPDATASAPEERPWWWLVDELDGFIGELEVFYASFAPAAGFARTIRDRFEQELERRQLLTFDGMLSRLADALQPGAEGAAALAERIRSRYAAVFVDEFQDTDVAQWAILRTAFHEFVHLFLIGDPKQAIYAFRGADVQVYLAAADSIVGEDRAGAGASVRTMGENWRSDPAAVEAMNHLWQPGCGAFEVEGIDYVHVKHRMERRLEPAQAGLEVRWLDARVRKGKDGQRLTRVERRTAAQLGAEEVHAWLSGTKGRIRAGKSAAKESAQQFRLPKPSDLAVLVRSHAEARLAQRALERLGIPAVVGSTDSVFDSAAARWVGAWLEAVASEGRDREARAAAVTPLVGWRGDELAWALAVAERGQPAREEAKARGVQLEEAEAPAAVSRDWNVWTKRLRAASERWKAHGFARTFDRELTELGAWPRLLRSPGGERYATDLRHLFELLHVQERASRLGPAPLAEWLRAQAGTGVEGTQQRLESDANAVRVETVHVSKGLEYPVVFLPFAWHAREERRPAKYSPLVLRGKGGTTVDLHPPSHPERVEAERAVTAEDRREATRQLYVALTRARHCTTAWWGPVGRASAQTSATPLGRLLMRGAGAMGYDRSPVADFNADPDGSWLLVKRQLDALHARSQETIAWTAARPPKSPARWVSPDASAKVLGWPEGRAMPTFSQRWGVTSYSGLAKGAAASDHDEKVRRDEPATAASTTRADEPATLTPRAPAVRDASAATADTDDVDVDGAAAPGVAKPSLASYDAPGRLSAGRGTVFGTFVHEVFEKLEFEAPPSRADGRRGTLEELVVEVGARHGFGARSGEVRELTLVMPRLLETPLDAEDGKGNLLALPQDFSLSRIRRRDRLDELVFDLRLGHGTAYARPGGAREASAGEPKSTLDARPGCVDPRKVYEALLSEPETAGIKGWLAFQRARQDRERALIGSIAGILTGSIDLTFRVGEGKAARYFVADYKTNKIESSEPGHYAGSWLDWKMATSGYLLQSLLYTLALHRHLTARLGKRGLYTYDENFGGALYLFARGMAGRSTPRDAATGRCLGVHAHRWSPRVIAALDEALAATEEPKR